jgi:hypothetical protein
MGDKRIIISRIKFIRDCKSMSHLLVYCYGDDLVLNRELTCDSSSPSPRVSRTCHKRVQIVRHDSRAEPA